MMKFASLLVILIAMTSGCTATAPTRHLFVKASHVDLGPWVEGTIAVSPVYGGRIDFAHPLPVYVDQTKTGCELAYSVVAQSDISQRPHEDLFLDAYGRIMRLSRQLTTHKLLNDTLAAQGVLTYDPILRVPQCSSLFPQNVDGYDYSLDTNPDGSLAVAPVYLPEELVVLDGV